MSGARYIEAMRHTSNVKCEHPVTQAILTRKSRKSAGNHWAPITQLVENFVSKKKSKRHYRECLAVANMEHMHYVDCFDGARMRRTEAVGPPNEPNQDETVDLLTVHPIVDGRLFDVGQRRRNV